MTTMVGTVAAWLLTYLVHSTLLLGGVALLTRYVVEREALRETLWKTALVGGLITATVAVALPRPVAPRVDVAALAVERGGSGQGAPVAPTLAAADAVAEREAADPTAPAAGAGGGEEVESSVGSDPSGPGAAVEPAGQSGAADEATQRAERAAADASSLLALAVAAWLVVALGLLGRLAYRHVRLRLLLRGREQVPGSEAAPSVLTELRRTAGVWKPVRLTFSSAVATPLALGTAEICLPARFLAELDPAEQRAALAHELAHLARRDPIWQVAGAVIGAVFFFQPLNLLARRAIRASAEYLADGWAVAQTGSQVELARCLASVAGWVAPSAEPALAGTVAMAEGGSPLLVRVERLLEHEPERATRPALRVAMAGVVLVAVAGFGPLVGGGSGSVSGLGPGDAAAEGGAAGLSDVESEAGEPADSSAAEVALAGQELVVVRAPATGDLAARLAWSRERVAGSGPYWVAWAVPSVLRAGSYVSMDSRQGRTLHMTDERGPADRWSDGGVASALGVADQLAYGGDRSDIVVLALVAPGGAGERIDRLAVRSPVLPMTLHGPVYWLGAVDGADGVDWLERTYRTADTRRVAVRALDAAALHDAAAAGALLRQVAQNTSAGRDGREQAIEGLRHHPTDASLALVARIARGDPDLLMRTEAAETLGEMRHPGAADVLRGLVRSDNDARVRAEALEALAEQSQDTALVATLMEVALGDTDPDLRREAVELLAELPSPQAVAALGRLARASSDPEVLEEVAESLGDVGTPAALNALDALLASDPGPRVAAEAIQAIAESFPADLVAPRLEAIARDDPSPDARREAVEGLADLRSASAVGGEPLLDIALHDGDPDLRRAAVEQIADLPAAEAVRLLRRVTFESGDGTAERQAAESLGDVGTVEALAVLDEIIERNPSEDASFQAVEAIAEGFSRDLSIPRLRRILQDHSSSRVRREALDRLGDVGG